MNIGTLNCCRPSTVQKSE